MRQKKREIEKHTEEEIVEAMVEKFPRSS